MNQANIALAPTTPYGTWLPSRLIRAALFALLLATGVTACTPSTSWEEYVILLDGREIKLEQTRYFRGAYDGSSIARLTTHTKLRFISNDLATETATFDDRVIPMLINVYKQEWYIVGLPPSGADYEYWGNPRHTYVPFRYDKTSKKWSRIPFADLPKEIYAGNLWMGDVPPPIDPVTVPVKEKERSRIELQSAHRVRVNPNYKSVGAKNAAQSLMKMTD